MRAEHGTTRTNTSSVDVQALRTVTGRAQKRGSAIVEFAVSFFVLMAFLFGIIDSCRAVYSYEFVTYAARAGARWAIVRGSSCYTNLSISAPSYAATWCYPGGTSYNGGAAAADVKKYVQGLHLPGIAGHLIAVTVTWPATGTACPASTSGSTSPINSPGCPVQVIVQYPYSSQIPFLRIKTITLTADSQMVISQ
jgi:Flp pilus assembly protein TadG